MTCPGGAVKQPALRMEGCAGAKSKTRQLRYWEVRTANPGPALDWPNIFAIESDGYALPRQSIANRIELNAR